MLTNGEDYRYENKALTRIKMLKLNSLAGVVNKRAKRVTNKGNGKKMERESIEKKLGEEGSEGHSFKLKKTLITMYTSRTIIKKLTTTDDIKYEEKIINFLLVLSFIVLNPITARPSNAPTPADIAEAKNIFSIGLLELGNTKKLKIKVDIIADNSIAVVKNIFI